MPSPARKPRSAKPLARRVPKTASRTYHHGDLGNALLDAASAVIAEHGVAQLKMRDLTRRIGVSHGAPANHFKGRDALLVALAIQGFERLTERQRVALAERHATPGAALIAIGIAYVQFAAEFPSHFEVMFQRKLLNDPALAEVAGRCFQQLLAAVAALAPAPVAAAKPARSGARREHELVALGSWALVHGLATLQAQGLLPAGGEGDDVATRVLRAMSAFAPAALRAT